MDAGNSTAVNALSSTTNSRTALRQALLRCGWLMCGLVWICIATTLCGCNSMSGWAMNRTGEAYIDRGDYTAARYEFQRAVIDQPKNVKYASNLAKTMELQGDISGAEQMYHRALDMNPEYQPAYRGLSNLLISQGRGEESRQLMTAWTVTQPYSRDAHVELADVERQHGNIDGARQQLAQALAMKPRSPKTLKQMGEFEEQAGNAPAAAAYYQKSLSMNPFQPSLSAKLSGLNSTGMSPGAMQSGAVMAQNFDGMSVQAAYAPQGEEWTQQLAETQPQMNPQPQFAGQGQVDAFTSMNAAGQPVAMQQVPGQQFAAQPMPVQQMAGQQSHSQQFPQQFPGQPMMAQAGMPRSVPMQTQFAGQHMPQQAMQQQGPWSGVQSVPQPLPAGMQPHLASPVAPHLAQPPEQLTPPPALAAPSDPVGQLADGPSIEAF